METQARVGESRINHFFCRTIDGFARKGGVPILADALFVLFSSGGERGLSMHGGHRYWPKPGGRAGPQPFPARLRAILAENSSGRGTPAEIASDVISESVPVVKLE